MPTGSNATRNDMLARRWRDGLVPLAVGEPGLLDIGGLSRLGLRKATKSREDGYTWNKQQAKC